MTAAAHTFRLPAEAPAVDEALARRVLRAQIARLETDLAAQIAGAPRPATFAQMLREAPVAGEGESRARPRLLSLGELEAQRDELAARLADERSALGLLADRQDGFRRLREEMLIDPAAHPHVRVSNADVGEPGCLDWHVRPRFGVLGMFLRWWRVKISSGCP